MWDELVVAVALLLVLEGIVPFVNPSGLRSALEQISRLSDKTIRIAGIISMSLGLVLLYFIRHK